MRAQDDSLHGVAPATIGAASVRHLLGRPSGQSRSGRRLRPQDPPRGLLTGSPRPCERRKQTIETRATLLPRVPRASSSTRGSAREQRRQPSPPEPRKELSMRQNRDSRLIALAVCGAIGASASLHPAAASPAPGKRDQAAALRVSIKWLTVYKPRFWVSVEAPGAWVAAGWRRTPMPDRDRDEGLGGQHAHRPSLCGEGGLTAARSKGQADADERALHSGRSGRWRGLNLAGPESPTPGGRSGRADVLVDRLRCSARIASVSCKQ